MRVCDVIDVCDNRNIAGISCNSKEIKDNFIFFAIKGNKVDGNAYIDSAIDCGAILVVTENKKYKTGEKVFVSNKFAYIYVVENVRTTMSVLAKQFYDVNLDNTKFVGVVGTSGKTTTTYILNHILMTQYKCGLIGTTGAFVGSNELYYGLTTPDPIDLFRIIKQMQDMGCEIIIMEISVQAIEYQKTFGILFDYCIFTNISFEHMDTYKNMHNYANLKMSFFTSQNVKEAVINVDDKYGREIASANKIPCITYGNMYPANAFAVNISEDKNQMSFVVNICDSVAKITTQIVGKYNVYNILASCVVAMGLKIKLSDIAHRLQSLRNIVGRYERIAVGNNIIIIDFAHTIDSIKKVIQTTKKLYKQNISVVIGCTGYSDKKKRQEIGKVLEKYCFQAILTSDNPQNEDVIMICQDIAKHIQKSKTIIITNRCKAIQYGIEHISGVLLLLGKGGEHFQKVGNKNIPYDEKETVLSILGGKK